mgnify:CR=1 FL=1
MHFELAEDVPALLIRVPLSILYLRCRFADGKVARPEWIFFQFSI